MMPKPAYLGPYPDVYVGSQRLWRVFAGSKKVWPEIEPQWLMTTTSRIFYSGDGTAWEEIPSYPAEVTGTISLANNDRTRGNNIAVDPVTGMWVVATGDTGAGYSPYVISSLDGLEWQAHDTGATVDLVSVEYGNGLWVVGQASERTLRYSSDLITWTAVSLPRIGSVLANNDGTAFYDVLYQTYGTRNWWVFGFRGAYYSSDGISWSATTQSYLTQQGWPRQAASDSLGGIVIPHESTAVQAIKSSTDGGVTWPYSTTVGTTPGGVAHGGGYFMTSSGHLSSDGISWSTLAQSGDEIAYDHTNSRWLMARNVVLSGTNTIQTSYSDDNGSTWSAWLTVATGENVGGILHNSGTTDTMVA